MSGEMVTVTDLFYFACSAKGFCVGRVIDSRSGQWVPKGLVRMTPEKPIYGGEVKVEMPRWLAEKKGFIECHKNCRQ